MTIAIVCGVDAGTDKKFRCYCCGFQSDDIDAFATSSCWPCSMGGNIDCKTCIKMGVQTAPMGEGTRYHLLKSPRTTRCGLRMRMDSWSGPGNCVACEVCVPPATGLDARVRQPLPWTASYWWGPNYEHLGKRLKAKEKWNA